MDLAINTFIYSFFIKDFKKGLGFSIMQNITIIESFFIAL